MASLPLIHIAHHWEIDVAAYAGQPGKALGIHRQTLLGEQIMLRAENLIVWLHELMHAADNKNGNMVEKGQHYRSEAVAQLGACTLSSAGRKRRMKASPGTTSVDIPKLPDVPR